MKVIQISDCHLYADIQRIGYNHINPCHSFEKVLLNAQQENPDLVLFTGDISGDASEQSYQHFKQLCGQYFSDQTWRYIPGNHDCPDKMRTLLTGQELLTSAPLDLGPWRIHGLNSHHQSTLGHVSQASLDLLENDITEEPHKCHLVAVHHHPILSQSWMDKHEWINRALFMAFIDKIKIVRAVIYGHIHTDKFDHIGQTDFYSCPSSCWQWEMQKEFGFSTEAPGYRLLDLGHDGTINSQVKRI